MSALLNLLYVRFKKFLPRIYAVLFLLLFVAVVYYVYKYIYLKEKTEHTFKDVANANTTGRGITIFMFHVDWCPHCKKAMPEWQMFSDRYNKTSLNGYQIECRDVDCTKSEEPAIKSMIDKYGLKQYPTVLAIVPSQDGKETVVEYEAKVKMPYLEKFVTSITMESN